MKHLIKLFYSLLLGIIVCSCSQHELMQEKEEVIRPNETKISIDEARTNLLKLLAELEPQRTKANADVRGIESGFSLPVGNSSTRCGESESEVYVFNFTDNQGYAIMSDDVRLPELIALADSGCISEDVPIENPGVADFLNGMDNVYTGISGDNFGDLLNPELDHDANETYNVYGEWENVVYAINGYCPVKWGQSSPYNNYCPLIEGKRSVTGCVATAVAQLMAIYEWPLSYNGYNFPWDSMISKRYAFNLPSETQNAIARLMQQLGLSNNLNVSYGVKSSGAKKENVTRTLSSFGFSTPGTLKDYDIDDLASEIQQGYPVLMFGYSFKRVTTFIGIKVQTSYEGGHAWLVHGLLERRRQVKTYSGNNLLNTRYETYLYPLCNWGWEGYQDGYYLSNAFDSTSGPVYDETTRADDNAENQQEGNFQFKITQITGIRK